ncbi:ABC transporter ATP-binding protein [Clostridium estertheticum]|uniref:ABC transporter ATP-binding protein n=1 Tax=Clostridium estertheticum TaxID=238834 RepID=UPI001C0C3A51|nr:ABC transporter ATP-binding protein [Clostridium estertheticum]MBU3184262.1 ABC transporter ATP-binding protein [Clostridium estertheticum]MCB2341092.1 ABC transporter ATP-binding protein [Clostridium estertheticum]
MKNDILTIDNLSKSYKDNQVLNNINLHIKAGTVYGFLGPNGAGKSTTIRIILGLIKKYTGDIKVFDHDLKKHKIEILNRVGALVESPSYYEHLSAYENLKIWAIMKNTPYSRIDEVLKIVDLYDSKNKKAGKFSLGMKQRLGIAQALINSPDLLILDEPTNGLDPIGIKEIRALIISLSKKYNKTILVSSHLLSEMELMVDDVGIINKGNVLYEGSLKELKSNYPTLNSLEDIFLLLVERS